MFFFFIFPLLQWIMRTFSCKFPQFCFPNDSSLMIGFFMGKKLLWSFTRGIEAWTIKFFLFRVGMVTINIGCLSTSSQMTSAERGKTTKWKLIKHAEEENRTTYLFSFQTPCIPLLSPSPSFSFSPECSPMWFSFSFFIVEPLWYLFYSSLISFFAILQKIVHSRWGQINHVRLTSNS